MLGLSASGDGSAEQDASAELCQDDAFVPARRLLPSSFASKRIFDFTFAE